MLPWTGGNAVAAKSKGGKGKGKKRARKKSGRKTPVPRRAPTTREKIARPLREAAARARRLLERLAGLRGAAGRKLREIYRHEPRAGDLESFQAVVEALEKHATAFDMPVDFSPLRRRLEALLSVLLEVDDDQLAAAAARPLAGELAAALHRTETLFLLPDALYQTLDPGMQYLAAVREAVSAEAHDLARDALLEHLRSKEPPEALVTWLLECPERCLAEAELIAHGFSRDLASQTTRDQGRIWRFVESPFRWEDVRFAPPHGHSETAVLARAYAASGNEALAAEAVARLLGWAVAAAPPPAVSGSGNQATEIAWEPELAAERLMNLGVCVLALRASHLFTPETARVALLLALEGAEYLVRRVEARPEGEEGLARIGAALAVAGEVFREFSASGGWRETGRRLLDEAATGRVLPDRGDASLCPDVHEHALDSFVAGALSTGPASPATGAAVKMLAFERAILMPGGELPGGHDPKAAAQRLARLDLAASLLGLAEERPAGPEFHAFGESGFYVMRTGREVGADCLLLRACGHWGLRVACSGREVLGGPASPVGGAAEGPTDVFHSAGPPCDYVRVVSGPGGGAGQELGAATHRREVLFFERRWWALADRVRSEEEAEWSLEFALDPPPEDSSPDGRRFVSGGLLVVLAGPTDTGFRFESDERGHAVARAASSGRDVSFVTLLYPLRGEDADSISVEPVAAGSGRVAGLVVRREGTEGLAAFPHGEDVELAAVPGDREAVALSRSGGAWRTVFATE